MILAGYETTANTLAFSVYLLAKHLQAQQCLLQEIDQFQGRPGYDSLPSFPYAAAVINEALRLYPPATFLERVATEDVQVRDTFTQFASSLTGCHRASCKLTDQGRQQGYSGYCMTALAVLVCIAGTAVPAPFLHN